MIKLSKGMVIGTNLGFRLLITKLVPGGAEVRCVRTANPDSGSSWEIGQIDTLRSLEYAVTVGSWFEDRQYLWKQFKQKYDERSKSSKSK